MKIYFAGSIRGGRNDVDNYKKIIEHLKKFGEVLTEHVGDYRLSVKGQYQLNDDFIRNRDIEWLKQSDVIVAETSNPSLGVGYELASAEKYNIPTIVLHNNNGKQLSAMISGTSFLIIFTITQILRRQ